MEADDLVVLDGQVLILLALLVRDLHEVAAYERLADARVQLPLVHRRHDVDLVSLHRAL